MDVVYQKITHKKNNIYCHYVKTAKEKNYAKKKTDHLLFNFRSVIIGTVSENPEESNAWEWRSR